MITVKFILRAPGNHHAIGGAKMSAVPRVGDEVAINDLVKTVHSVRWDVLKKEVLVYLDA